MRAGVHSDVTYRSQDVARERPQPVAGKTEGELSVRNAHNGAEHDHTQKSVQARNPPTKEAHPEHVSELLQSAWRKKRAKEVGQS